MKKIPLIFLLISTALVLHPATRARLQNILDLAGALQSELRSAFVDAPIAKARVEYRAEAERQAREQAEIRMKQIDKAVERAVQGSDN